MTMPPLFVAPVAEVWSDLSEIATAHVLMLRETGIIDTSVLAVVLTVLDGVSRGAPPGDELDLASLIAAFDERVDALTPAGAVGTVSAGRGRNDTAAALARLAIRRDALALARSTTSLRRTLIGLAGQHAATTMPAFISGIPAQPTTFGHFLGGVIAPLGRAAARLQEAIIETNRSPLGAVALASTSLPIDRERVADLLGYGELVDNTFDAVIAFDHLVAVANAAAGVSGAVRRFIDELLIWLRTDPASLRIDERWMERIPGLPQMAAPAGLDRIVAVASTALAAAGSCEGLAATAGYEPLGRDLDGILQTCRTAVVATRSVVEAADELFREGIEINRAYLANTAGRNHTTSSDLAIFLMEAEGLDPAAAANIAAMTVNRAIADGIEASGITTQMIDASALLIIGRELAVEFEAISRYLAPRRFLERRTATGSPAPAKTREYLGREEQRLMAHEEWITALVARIGRATSDREQLVREAIADAT